MKNFLSRNPIDCKVREEGLSVKGASAWYYEEGRGLTFVVHVRENEYVHIEISWRTILASVGRYLKSKGKKIIKGGNPEI